MAYYWEKMNENNSELITKLFSPKIIKNENDKFKQEPIKFKLMMNDCVQIDIKNLVINFIYLFVNKINYFY
jgi:hypothetical protein